MSTVTKTCRRCGKPFPRDRRCRRCTNARQRATYRQRGMCLHCQTMKCARPRGLCCVCFDQTEIREQYPTSPRWNRTGTEVPPDKSGPCDPPPYATNAPPGSDEKMDVLSQRALAGVDLFHAADASAWNGVQPTRAEYGRLGHQKRSHRHDVKPFAPEVFKAARAMLAAGKSNGEVSEELGVSKTWVCNVRRAMREIREVG